MLEGDTPSGVWHGVVGYVHGPGIDQPLVVYRRGLEGQPDPVVVVPHADWRGEWAVGTFLDGTSTVGCTGTYGCPVVPWAAGRVTVDGELKGGGSAGSWWGSLVGRKTDGSRLQYLRNRYYDPASGRFTQEDPVGLAGGLNLYGFANGDPINFSDPFGLCPEGRRNEAGLCPGGLSVEQWNGLDHAIRNHVSDAEVASELLRRLDAGMISPAAPGDRHHIWGAEANTPMTPDGEVGTYIFTMTSSGLNTFDNDPSDLAFVLGHELGHIRQLNFYGPYTTPWDRRRFMRQYVFDRTPFERGADRFACSVVTGSLPRYGGRCQ